MPTDRFYHLPEEKKRLIREAAIKEFCRMPLEKASINKIVQNADISRGSFYTYFRDKEDVLEYIFGDVISQVQNFCIEFLIREKGEFWRFPKALLDYTINICETNKMFTLSQVALGNRTMMQLLQKKISGMMGGPFCPKVIQGKTGQPAGLAQEGDKADVMFQKLYQLTDCSKLRINDVEDFQELFSLCIFNMVMTIGEIYQKGVEKENAVKSFEKRIRFIQYGAAKGG